MQTGELKKQIRFLDLALASARKRQSGKTGFVHDGEVIPIYENYCFAFALFRQKNLESVKEGKVLLERLLALDCFPIYFHEFPCCFDSGMGLKIAPILIHFLREFGSILGDLREKIEKILANILRQRPGKISFENRFRACVGEPLIPAGTTNFSPQEWLDWIITAQLAGHTHFEIPFHEELQLFLGPSQSDVQEKGEPRPNPIEWLLADGKFSPRLLKDHPHQILLAPLFPITYTPAFVKESTFRLFWKGTQSIHSLVGKSLTYDLQPIEMERDLFEVCFFTNISPETSLFVSGRRATTFKLGEKVTLQTPTKSIDLIFHLSDGSGDFLGHIFKANRPSQIEKGEAYDWQIALRTLRRSPQAKIIVEVIQ